MAAFSLYLAFLHYQEPREINEQRRLPNLKWARKRERDRDREQQYDILLDGNAFDSAGGKLGSEVANRFGPATADVVVGNPPWGYPKQNDEIGRKAMDGVLQWCEEGGRNVGDKELSQAFIHLALVLLREGGKAGMLVSSGVLFKHHPKSREFRRTWLSRCRLEHIVNFAHVRHLFFRGETRRSEAIAPFVSVVFEKNADCKDNRFAYWSAKRTAYVENTQAVIISKGDMHWLSQRACLTYEKLWKIYWWGGHRDEALIRSLERFPSLVDLPQSLRNARVIPAIGFVEGKVGKKPSGWLKEFKELPVDAFESYGPLALSGLVGAPNSVRRRGSREAYEGRRLLVGRGIPASGKLTARLESRSFCFRHSIFAFRLVGFNSWQEKVLLGIFWSSLARYYLFMTAGSWGMWHDELSMEIAGDMPIAFPDDLSRRARLVNAVEKLQAVPIRGALLEFVAPGTQHKIRDLERELDDAVFDLYGLNQAERNLIQDMCEVGLDFLYGNQSSAAAKPVSLPVRKSGTLSDIGDAQDGLGAYLKTFLQIWNRDLEPETELAWRVLTPSAQSPLIAVLFSTKPKEDRRVQTQPDDSTSWTKVLKTLDKHSRQTEGSRRIYTDSFVRLVVEDEIEDEVLIIKRNELRFWTRSAAREDAEATQLQAMQLQEAKN